MQIQRVTLSRWCQLDGDYEFGPGLNCIRGPNGAGKTNLINSVVFALTGDVSRLHGVKADNINFFADKKDKSFAEVHFLHENVEGKLLRVLQPNARQELQLFFKGETKKVTRDNEINLELEKLLGINQRMLLDYVFVPQWGIFKFIDQQPSVRARALAELFGADRAEKIYRDLGEVKIDIPSASVDADIVRSRIQTNKKELTSVVEQLSQFAGMPEKIDDAVKTERETIKRYDRRAILLSNIKTMEDNKTSRIERLEALMFEITPLLEQHDEMKEALEAAGPNVEAAKKGLQDWRLYDNYEQSRASLTHSLAEIEAAIKKLQAPAKPANLLTDAEQSELRAANADLNLTLRRYQQIIKDFDTGASTECPTCGTPVALMSDHLDECRTYVNRTPSIIAVNTKRLKEHDDYRVQFASYQAQLGKLQAQQESLHSQLQRLKIIDKPSSDRVVFQSLIDNYDATDKKFKYMHETLYIGEGKVNDMKSQLKGLDDLLIKYKAEAATLGDVGEFDAEIAARKIDQMTERFVERDTLRNRKRDVERLIEDDEEALDKCKVNQLRADRLKQTEIHLQSVRQIYRDLITMIPQHNMEELRNEVNDNLNRFGTRFRVEAIDDLRFLLRYHSGRVQPAERLSGGERVLLALAFRIAVNSRYAKELGLLCLDEPTAGLDEDNLGCLEVALGRLRELSQARGLQVIMVTHDSGLDGLFDRVIQLQAAS